MPHRKSGASLPLHLLPPPKDTALCCNGRSVLIYSMHPCYPPVDVKWGSFTLVCMRYAFDHIMSFIFVFFRAQTMFYTGSSLPVGILQTKDNGRTNLKKKRNTFHCTVIIMPNCVPKALMLITACSFDSRPLKSWPRTDFFL